MSKFKTTGDVQLINGGYLSDKSKKPVTNKAFVAAQRKADWLVTLAGKMKGKTFEATSPTNINDLIRETNEELDSNKAVEFVAAPKAPKGKLTEELKKEALAFVEHAVESQETERVNEKLQEFKSLSEFEEFGLFFSSGVVKLNKIYTLAEVTEAAKVVYRVL